MKLGVSFANQILAEPVRVMGKTRHMITSAAPHSAINLLNFSTWLVGSPLPSYGSNVDILNFSGNGKFKVSNVNGRLDCSRILSDGVSS